jgi:ATP-dependent Clp protease, protease subunit
MIHNAWICGCGNRNDFADFIKVLEQLDNSMAEVYADRTGIKIEEIKEYMDKETYFSGSIAVENDFADSLLQDEEIKKEEDDENKTQSSIRKVDILLAKQGLTRSERKTLLKDIKGGMSGTVANATLDAGLKDIDVSMQLIKDAINILSK